MWATSPFAAHVMFKLSCFWLIKFSKTNFLSKKIFQKCCQQSTSNCASKCFQLIELNQRKLMNISRFQLNEKKIMTNNKLQLQPCEQINFVFNSFLMPAFFSGNLLSAHFLIWEIKLTMKFNCLTPFNSHGLTVRLMDWAVNSWTHNLAFKSHGIDYKKILKLPENSGRSCIISKNQASKYMYKFVSI